MTVTVRYYARLREEAGFAEERVNTQAATVAALWNELQAKHGFTLEARLIKAAQDDEFCDWDSVLRPGLVVFMPPVAGG